MIHFTELVISPIKTLKKSDSVPEEDIATDEEVGDIISNIFN